MSGWVVLLVVLVASAAAAALVTDLRTLPRRADTLTKQVRVAVVVPARDEERSLPTLLESLHAQSVAVSDVVVVDDDSSDGTATVARAAGARVVSASPPPAGWTGKAWACHTGAGEACGDLLLFLDADTTLAPDALARLLQAHEAHGGLVSVQPHHDVVRPHEQLSAYFNLVSVMASSAFGPLGGRRSMAFGPCLLTSREDYRSAGGHQAVRGEVLDDASLAEAYHRAGLPVWCAIGAADVRMRSYPDGLGQLVAGWTKNIASGASSAGRVASLTTVGWISVHHVVAVGTVTALVDRLVGRPSTVGLAVWGLAWLVTSWQLRTLLRRIGSFAWWTWALFPVTLVTFDLVFARSAVLTAVRRTVSWRGRDVPVERRSAGEVG